MARVETIVVGGGVAGVAPFTLNGIPYVVNTDPAGISTTDFLSVDPSGADRAVIVSVSGDPLTGNTERLRVKGGIVSELLNYTLSETFGRNQVVTGNRNGQRIVTMGMNNTLTGGSGNPTLADVVVGETIAITCGGTNFFHGNVVMGSNITLSTTNSVNQCTAVGRGISVTGATSQISSVYYGQGITDAGGGQNVIMGYTCTNAAASSNTVIVGVGCQVQGSSSTNCVIFGISSQSSSANAVIVGSGSTVATSSLQSTIVGNGTQASAQSCVVVGFGSQVTNVAHTNNVLVGTALSSFRANTAMIGTASFSQVLDMLVFGGLDTTSNAPATYTVRFSNQSGTNKAAPNVVVQGGLGTGTGTVGNIQFITSVAAASGTTQHTTQERMRLDGTTTAGQTAMLLWDVDNATLERVTVGAADSGGVGFKVLRIPN